MTSETISPKEQAELFASDLAQHAGREALLAARQVLANATRDLDRYIDGYEGSTTNSERAQQLNGAINHLASNIMGNLRIDTLADCQAHLVRLKG
jgi:hypothetical protein